MNSSQNLLALAIRLQRSVVISPSPQHNIHRCCTHALIPMTNHQRYASNRAPVPLMGLGKGNQYCIKFNIPRKFQYLRMCSISKWAIFHEQD